MSVLIWFFPTFVEFFLKMGLFTTSQSYCLLVTFFQKACFKRTSAGWRKKVNKSINAEVQSLKINQL